RSSPVFDRSVERGHVLLHELRADLTEVSAKAVPERLALGLTVVRKHHDVIAPGGSCRESLESSEYPVQTVESRHGLWTEHARVMGDLVVVDVVDEDALPSLAHLLGDDRSVEIALEHIGGGAQSGVGPSPVNSRQDVEAVLAGSLPALLRHLGDGPYPPAAEAIGVGQEPGERLPSGRGPAGDAEAAHRKDGAGRVAGEEVASGEAFIAKQPRPTRRALLGERGIVWPVRNQDSPQLTVVPAKRWDSSYRAVQDPELTGWRSAGRLGCPPLKHIVPCGHPTPHGLNPARLNGPAENRECDAV